MADSQINLFDMGLKTAQKSEAEDFTDTAAETLKKLSWYSERMQTFYYDELENMKLTSVRLKLKGIRRLKKDGKFEFALERSWFYSGLEECIEDEIKFGKIEELEELFEDEKYSFEQLRKLPEDVLFDGRRYFWKFQKTQDGTIYFAEKWMPQIIEDY
jgi:hypothetical protein